MTGFHADNYFLLAQLEALTRGKDIPFLARALAEQIGRPVIVTNAVDRLLVFQDPLGAGPAVGEYFAVPAHGAGQNHPDLFAGPNKALCEGVLPAGEPYLLFPLRAAGQLYGHCVVLTGNAERNEGIVRYAWQAAVSMLLALKDFAQQQAEQERYQDELIRDILYNNFSSRAGILDKARSWNWDLSGPLAVVVVSAPGDQLPRAREMGPRLFQGRSPIYARINGQLVVLLSCEGLERRKLKEALQRQLGEYAERLQDLSIGQIRVGVGSVVPSVTDLYRSYQEAKVALEMGRAFSRGLVCHFDEMGVFQFIFAQPGYELQEFCERVLGPILEYDAAMETELLATLKAYIEAHCQIPDCARALYVHENTLRNRLKKIQELTGQDLRRVDHLVSLFIALQIMHLGQED